MHNSRFRKTGKKYIVVTEKAAKRLNDRLYVPQIRIAGKYLGVIGFIPGKKAVVQYEPNKITIFLDESMGKED